MVTVSQLQQGAVMRMRMGTGKGGMESRQLLLHDRILLRDSPPYLRVPESINGQSGQAAGF